MDLILTSILFAGRLAFGAVKLGWKLGMLVFGLVAFFIETLPDDPVDEDTPSIMGAGTRSAWSLDSDRARRKW